MDTVTRHALPGRLRTCLPRSDLASSGSDDAKCVPASSLAGEVWPFNVGRLTCRTDACFFPIFSVQWPPYSITQSYLACGQTQVPLPLLFLPTFQTKPSWPCQVIGGVSNGFRSFEGLDALEISDIKQYTPQHLDIRVLVDLEGAKCSPSCLATSSSRRSLLV